MKRNCFVCRKQIVASMREPTEDMDFDDPPRDATCWTTRGNYGSTIIDSGPGDPTFEICICDECVKERAGLVTWYHQVPQHRKAVFETGTVGSFPFYNNPMNDAIERAIQDFDGTNDGHPPETH